MTDVGKILPIVIDIVNRTNEIKDVPEQNIITQSEAYQTLKTAFGTRAAYFMADRTYETVSRKTMREIVQKHRDDFLIDDYIKEAHDCDDYSFRFKGLVSTPEHGHKAIFIVWSRNHAFNAFIDHDNTVWLIEPIYGYIMLPENAGKIYTPVRLVIG